MVSKVEHYHVALPYRLALELFVGWNCHDMTRTTRGQFTLTIPGMTCMKLC
jgi:hypothetical protein